MKMKALHLTALATLVVAAAVAQASPFYYPPEDHAPRWTTQFPYQRNIDFTFDNPLNIWEPHYEGYLDDELKASDTITYQGNLWYLRWGRDLQNGAIGAYMDGSPDDKLLDLYFGFDNVKQPNPVKRIWMEIIYKVVGNPTGELNVIAPDTQITGREEWDFKPDFLTDGWRIHKAWFELMPNPDHETINLKINLENPGDAVWIDRFHIATECVPEPASLSAMAIGLGISGLLARRRRK